MRIDPGTVEGMDDFFLYTVEDFLGPSYFKYLTERALTAGKYSYLKDSAYGMDNKPDILDACTRDMGQFTYPFMVSGAPLDIDMFRFLEPMLFQIYDAFPDIQFRGVNRAKFNILIQQPDAPTSLHDTPHVDIDSKVKNLPIYTGLFYISGTDGDTVFFKERYDPDVAYPDTITEFTRLPPKPNTLVLFNSAYYHASSSPRTGDARCVMNVIFDAEKKSDPV